MNLQKVADILISSWTLGSEEGAPLPTGQGILDRALKRTIEDGNFPEEFHRLRFVNTRVGTRCPELKAVLSWAQAAEQTSDPNPSYSVTETKPSKEVAFMILDELAINPDDARRWGRALANAIRDNQRAT